jgi:predicted aminopeptidase
MPPFVTIRKSRRISRCVWLFSIVVSLVLVTGCKTVGYYGQALSGQYQIFSRSQPIEKVLARPDTRQGLRDKLQLVLDVRKFAEEELQLKTDGHYSEYADLGRRYVVWNVYAAPEFSLEPKKWWYPVVGSLKYRGFFSEKDAHDCGERLAREGYDVHVGGVEAYSTLGWFKDPVLNTFIHNESVDLAETLFHELAHQRVFAKGDTDFNEAFATAVGEEGARRWLAVHGDEKSRAAYEIDLRRKDQFVALIMKARQDLQAVYGDNAGGQSVDGNAAAIDARRAAKDAVIAQLRADYAEVKKEWGGYSGYDNWFQRPINNARLNTVAAYYTLVPAFKQLLAQHEGDLHKFYDESKAMAGLPKEKRQERMAALSQPAPAVAAASTLPSASVAQSR